MAPVPGRAHRLTTAAFAAVVIVMGGCELAAPPRSPPSSAIHVPGQTATALNPVEQRIEAALSRVGLVAKVAEMSPQDRASMWVDIGDGGVLSIQSVPASVASEWQIVDDRQLPGIELRRVRGSDGMMSEWIVCGPDLVRVSGSPPEADGTLDALIERLVPELGCR